MGTVALLFVVVAAVVFVGWPLFRPEAGEMGHQSECESPLERQKLEAYAAIKEVELDRRMGKLSEADCATQVRRYRGEALQAIAALDKLRQPGAGGTPRTAERRAARFAFCPTCGQRIAERANFCGACGRKVSALS